MQTGSLYPVAIMDSCPLFNDFRDPHGADVSALCLNAPEIKVGKRFCSNLKYENTFCICSYVHNFKSFSGAMHSYLHGIMLN
jgi:hypothetical protein